MAKKLRNYIKAHRKNAGLTQEQVAEGIGRDVSVVSRVERGEIKITQEILEDMAPVLGCDDPIDLLFPPEQKQALRLLKAMIDGEPA